MKAKYIGESRPMSVTNGYVYYVKEIDKGWYRITSDPPIADEVMFPPECFELYKYEYMICTVVDEDIYYKQCAALEKHIPELQKLDELHDVDNSRLQEYLYYDKTIRVLNDYQLNAVHIESAIPLEPFFENRDDKLDEGMADLNAGRVMPSNQVREEMQRKYKK